MADKCSGWQLQREVPITLVLGLMTSASLLDQLLSGPAHDALSMQTFPLIQVLPWTLYT